MGRMKNALWGIVLIAAGLLIAVNALGLAEIDIFFDGWWTLLIIIPCAVGLFTEREKTGNLIGVVIGVLLLLACRDILDFSLIWKLLVPAVIVVIGVKLVLGALFGNKANAILVDMKKNGESPKVGFAAFSGCDMHFDNEEFGGAELTAVFGGVECDLRKAVIEKDCAIRVTAVFGGIDILVPDHVNVRSNTTALFGGVSNKTALKKDAPTIYISGICMFGGVEIK